MPSCGNAYARHVKFVSNFTRVKIELQPACSQKGTLARYATVNAAHPMVLYHSVLTSCMQKNACKKA
jgi:hypothetical protein